MEKTEVAQLLDEALHRQGREVMGQLDAWLLRLDSILRSQMIHETTAAVQLRSQEYELAPQKTNTELDEEDKESSHCTQRPSAASSPGRLTQRSVTGRRFSRVSYDEALDQAARVQFERSVSQSAMKHAEQSGMTGGCLQHIQRQAEKLSSSSTFDMFFLMVIISNSILLGVQLEMIASSSTDDAGSETSFLVLNFVYAVAFTFEIVVRLIAKGLKTYFCGSSWAWGWLDAIVVISAWVELAGEVTTQSGGDGEASSNLRIIRIFRVTRLLQTVRSLRMIRFLTALRTIVYSMVGATKSLFWILLLLCLILYIFSILFTDAVVHHAQTNPDSIHLPEMRKYFGSVSTSMNTLYRSVLAGVDWSEPADELYKLGSEWLMLFNFFIALSMLALLNVMTGLFSSSSIRAAERNHDVMMQNRTALREAAARLFEKMDMSGFGTITITEFEAVYEDEDMKTFLESLEISATDAWTLFNSLNLDGNHVLTLDEFTEGCLLLRGNARSVDVFALKQQNKKIREQISGLTKMHTELSEFLLERDTISTRWPPVPHGPLEVIST
ncbi:Scn11a [Symbiodinium sp. CCMP2456]|nr:Scn11a [Symbiodinium sp. CCMP2456]